MKKCGLIVSLIEVDFLKKKLCILLLIIFSHSVSFAAPAFHKSVSEPIELPGKTLHERFLSGRASGYMLAPASYPTATINILFLRVEFQEDLTPASSQTTGSGLWKDYRYNDDPDFWVNRSQAKFVEYWKEVSYGLLPLQVDISQQIYKLPGTMKSYGDESNAAIENLIYDSVNTAATDTALIFSQYDAVLIVHAGVGQESASANDSTNDIWSLYYGGGSCISSNVNSGATCLSIALRDGNPIREAIIMPQTDSRSTLIVDPLGVYVHEFGHWLGLPDLYCTAYQNCPGGVGDWSLMEHGSYNRDPDTPTWYGSSPSHLDAWSLYYLGWIAPQIVPMSALNESISLNSIESVPAPEIAAQGTNVYIATASSGTTHQYFLMENRQQLGFDRGLPGQGLLVWLVDQDVITLNLSSNTINNNVTRPGLKLIEADGDWSLLAYGIDADSGTPGDPFPGTTGNQKLSPLTTPSSIPYANYGLVNLRNIALSESGSVSFYLGFGPLPPPADSIVSDLATKTVTWPSCAGAASYSIYKNGVLPQSGVTAGGSPSFTDNSMQETDVYVIVSVDSAGNESQPSSALSLPPDGGGGAGSGGGGSSGPCFIATAAYGSSLDPHVAALRKFRDEWLMTNAAGRVFVKYYYRISPPIAEFINNHDSARVVVRWTLAPVVYAVEYPGIFQAMTLAGAALLVLVLRRKKPSGGL